MDFVVEDGTGLADSTSYTTTEFADSYLGDDWVPTVEEKESALIEGSSYIDLRWGSSLRGAIEFTIQALEFPRIKLYDRYGRLIDGVPEDVQRAACLYGLEFYKNTLYPVNTGEVYGKKRYKVVVGPITEDTEYANNGSKAPAGSTSQFYDIPQADRLMVQYTGNTNSAIRM